MLSDSKRFELLNQAKNVIEETASEFKPLLCMLGKSLVIVPKNIDNDDNLELSRLIYELNEVGFITKKTRIGRLF